MEWTTEDRIELLAEAEDLAERYAAVVKERTARGEDANSGKAAVITEMLAEVSDPEPESYPEWRSSIWYVTSGSNSGKLARLCRFHRGRQYPRTLDHDPTENSAGVG